MTVPFGIGKPVRRKEDLRLVTGRGEFSDDTSVPDQAHAIVLRYRGPGSAAHHCVLRGARDTRDAKGRYR